LHSLVYFLMTNPSKDFRFQNTFDDEVSELFDISLKANWWLISGEISIPREIIPSHDTICVIMTFRRTEKDIYYQIDVLQMTHIKMKINRFVLNYMELSIFSWFDRILSFRFKKIFSSLMILFSMKPDEFFQVMENCNYYFFSFFCENVHHFSAFGRIKLLFFLDIFHIGFEKETK
jgi:hypothetical protein